MFIRSLCALGILVSGAAAQAGLSSSPSYVLRAQVTPNAGNASASASYSAKLVVGEAGAAGMESNSYQTVLGAAATTGSMGPIAPVLFGISTPSGGKEGGELTTLAGIGLADGGAPGVQFGSSPASSVNVLSGTSVEVQVPPGISSLLAFSGVPTEGNPIGLVDVELVTSLGTSRLGNGYGYLPAMLPQSKPLLGSEFVLRMQNEVPGSFCALTFGLPIAGLGLHIQGIGGALELLALVQPLGGLVATGALDHHDYLLPIPEQASLIGQTVYFQGVVIRSLVPLEAEFTAAVGVTLQG